MTILVSIFVTTGSRSVAERICLFGLRERERVEKTTANNFKLVGLGRTGASRSLPTKKKRHL